MARPRLKTELFDDASWLDVGTKVSRYPQLRLMGNKFRLLPWIASIFADVNFSTALDAFSGSGCVGYLLKSMGKEVTSNDFLNFSYHIANALIANQKTKISDSDLINLLKTNKRRKRFITTKFDGIFFTDIDNNFLDNTWANLRGISNPFKKSMVIAAMCRSCLKKQPRGVFTTRTANNGKYDDGRRDLRISLKEHFLESIELFNSLVYDNKKSNKAVFSDIFKLDPSGYGLVYMDPPYVPRSDDNCYIKRYHFLEGLSCYWEGQEILETSVVKKIKKKYTPFSYRKTSIQAFQELFDRFKNSIIILSYSSNGYPDKPILLKLLRETKGKDNVFVETENHTYHFGTHKNVSSKRTRVEEYLFIGA
jgi:DNA adenine methylase/adenine-specific DNA-methyltransferase